MSNFMNNPRVFVGLGITGLIIAPISMYFRYEIEKKIGDQDLCKSGLQEMLNHSSSVEVLGEPIKCGRPNLKKTLIYSTESTICVPVSGSKKSGDFYIKVVKQETEPVWTIASLILKTSGKEITVR